MKFVARFCLALPLLAALAARPLAAQQRPITQDDLYHFKWVADPRISPDGGQVAYVLVTVNAKHTGYETSIWSVPTDASSPPRQLTSGVHDSAPRWSPDSRTLAFVRSEEKGRPQIYLLGMSGGEARQLTDAPRGASTPNWSPDGKTIAFTSQTKPSDLTDSAQTADCPCSERDSAKGEPRSDVKVITQAIFRSNGEGFLDLARHRHIWTVPVELGANAPVKAEQITSGDYDEGDVAWSPDGSRIYFTSDRVAESYYYPPNSDVYSVPATGGSMEKVIDIDGPIDGAIPSPDGNSFAFAGFLNPPRVRSDNQTDLFVSARSDQPKNLAANYDFSIGDGPGGDQAAPRGGGGSSPLIWTADGKEIIVATGEHGTSNLRRFDVASGRSEALTTGDHDIMAYTATPDASKFALTISDPTHIGDVYAFNAATKQLTQLTHINDSLFVQLELPEPEQFWYRSFDGKKIEGWILKPPDFSPSKKYPLILEIHGGPHTAYGYTFFHEFQWMAAKGYIVLYTNPRGSTSYGQEFANIIQYRYPGDDYKDLMVAVDSLVRRGYVDEKRMGVTGGSGGGLLTNWTVTQTNRFAAAVSQRSVADWIGFWYTADFTLFTPSWFRTMPFQDPEEFLRRSPTRFAGQIETPLMLIDGEADLRTPSGQGTEAMFRSLKAQRKPTVMVLFPRESHELSRSGEPMHRVERLQHILNWFDKYLQGKSITEYSVQ
ncbi:MAG TPA: S9 family peptidase [Gemmatimonadaceae bacterium]